MVDSVGMIFMIFHSTRMVLDVAGGTVVNKET